MIVKPVDFLEETTVTDHCCRPTKRRTADLSTADCQHAHWRSLVVSEEDTETTAARPVKQAQVGPSPQDGVAAAT